MERHENAGLKKVWSKKYDMLKGDGSSHAMGIENLGNGQFKFMDPNSGEFHLHDKAALRHVVTQNARLMGYANASSTRSEAVTSSAVRQLRSLRRVSPKCCLRCCLV